MKLINSFLSGRKFRTKIGSYYWWGFLKYQSWEFCILLDTCVIFLYTITILNIVNSAGDTTLYAYEPNMDLVLSKLEKDTSTVFTWFQNNYLKANSGKSHLLTTSDNIQHINIGGNQLSSSKYEELLGIIIDHKLTFENHLLNIVQKVNQKLHALARIFKYMPQKKLRITMNAFISSHFAYFPLIWIFHSTQINHKVNKLHERALRII